MGAMLVVGSLRHLSRRPRDRATCARQLADPVLTRHSPSEIFFFCPPFVLSEDRNHVVL